MRFIGRSESCLPREMMFFCMGRTLVGLVAHSRQLRGCWRSFQRGSWILPLVKMPWWEWQLVLPSVECDLSSKCNLPTFPLLRLTKSRITPELITIGQGHPCRLRFGYPAEELLDLGHFTVRWWKLSTLTILELLCRPRRPFPMPIIYSKSQWLSMIPSFFVNINFSIDG